jgi:hypothetical protein
MSTVLASESLESYIVSDLVDASPAASRWMGRPLPDTLVEKGELSKEKYTESPVFYLIPK